MLDRNPGVDPLIFDARLTELGKRQAAELGTRLRTKHYDLVLVSPLTRAIETALGIFGERKLNYMINHGHCERLEHSGDVGRPPHLLALDFPHLDFSHLDAVWWHDHEMRNEHGFAVEPDDVFDARVIDFVERLKERGEDSIAVIGHAAFFYRLTGHWMNNCEVQAFDPYDFVKPHRFIPEAG